MKLAEVIGRFFFILKKDYFVVFPYFIFTLLVFVVSKSLEGLKVSSSGFQYFLMGLMFLFWLMDMLAHLMTMRITWLVDRDQPVSLKACFADCFKKIWPFIFSTSFSYLIIFGLSFVLAYAYYTRPLIMPGVFFLGIIFFNLLLLLWPAAIATEDCGPLEAFKLNFLKIFQSPGGFFNLVVLFLFIQLLGFLVSIQFMAMTGTGEMLSFLIMGLTMALAAMLRVLGYVRLVKK